MIVRWATVRFHVRASIAVALTLGLATLAVGARAAPLELAVTANPDPVTAGGLVTYEITVSNLGSALPEGTTLSFVVPDNVSFSRSLPSIDAVCEGFSTCTSGLTAQWTLGPLGSGQSRSIRVPATIVAGTGDGTIVTLNPQARFDNAVVLHEAFATVSVAVESSPGLSLVHTASPGPVAAATVLEYTLDASNPTNVARDDVVLAMDIPAGTTLLSSGGGTHSNGTVSFDLGRVLAGQRVRRQLSVTVDALADGTLLEALSRISDASDSEPVARAGVTRIVRGDSPVGLRVVANPGPVSAGGVLTYELTVSNPALAVELEAVELSFQVPPGVRFSRSLPSIDAVCEGFSICAEGHTARFTLGRLNAGQSRTVRVPATVEDDASDGALIPLQAKVEYSGMDAPAHTAMTAVVESSPGLSLVHTASPGPVAAATVLEYTLDASNPTNVARDDVVLAMDIPAGTTLLSSGGGTHSNGTVSFDLGRVLAGQRVRRQLSVTVDALADGTLLEALSRISDASDSEPVARAGVTRIVRGDSPVGLRVVANPGPVSAGGVLTYELTVSNPALAVELEAVELSFQVPPGVRFSRSLPSIDAVCEGFSICAEGHTARFTLGRLNAGQSRTVRVPATVEDDASDGALIPLQAKVEYSGMDAPAHTAMTAVVESSPGLSLVHTASPGPVAAATVLEYTLDASNPTNVARDDVVLAMDIPAGTTLLSSGGGTHSNGTVSFDLGRVLAGQRVRRQLSVTVDALADGTLLEALSRISDASDSEPVARAGVTRIVRGDSPVGLRVVANPGPVSAGGVLTYELTVSNPALAVELEAVELSFQVPPGVRFSRSLPSIDAVCEGFSICAEGHTARFTLGRLNAGQSRTVRVPATVEDDASDGALIPLQAKVEYSGMDAPAHTAMTAVVESSPGLSLVHTASPGPVAAATVLEYTLDASNPTNVARDDVVLAMDIPAGTTLLSSGGGTHSNGTVSFDLGRVLAGQRVRRQLSVTVDALADGTLLEALSRISDASDSEPVARAGVMRIVRGDSPVGLRVVANPDPVSAGGTVTHTWTVENTSSFRQLDEVVLGFQVPAASSFSRTAPDPDATCGGFSTCAPSLTALFALGTLVPGASAIVTVPSIIDSDAPAGTLVALQGELTFTGIDAPVVTERVSVVDPTLTGVDTDGDGLSDSDEIGLGTNPNLADTDNDGLSDGVELGVPGVDADPSTTTDPLNADTDGDGLLDGSNGVNLACEDCNNDGLQDPGETTPLLETEFPACATLDVAAGFNIVAHPSPAPGLDCFDLLWALLDSGARSLQRFNVTTAKFESCAVEGDPGSEQIVGANFSIMPGTGYLLHMTDDAQIEFPGCILPSPAP